MPPDGARLEQGGYISPDEEGEEEEGYQQTSSELKRKRSPTRAYVAGYSQDERGDQAPSQPATNTNNYPPYNPIPAQTANQYASIASPTTPYTPTQSVVPNDKPSLLDYVYQKQYPPNGKKRHQILHQAERESSNPSILNKRVRISTESSSMSPSMQLIHPPAVRNEAGNTALIDTLSKKKQREILGILGGLQSGIRLVRQQTDSLQRQLDALQGALGIDLEDEGEGT